MIEFIAKGSSELLTYNLCKEGYDPFYLFVSSWDDPDDEIEDLDALEELDTVLLAIRTEKHAYRSEAALTTILESYKHKGFRHYFHEVNIGDCRDLYEKYEKVRQGMNDLANTLWPLLYEQLSTKVQELVQEKYIPNGQADPVPEGDILTENTILV